jgi:hypothetical protein
MIDVHITLIEFLKEKNIDFKSIQHKPTTTSEESAKIRGTSLSQGFKNFKLKPKEQNVY